MRHREPFGKPSYLIVGGVIFTALTCGLLDVAVEVLSEEAWQRGRSALKEAGEQVIVIIQVLGHPVNHGYDIHRLPLLTEFQGEKVRNMKDLFKKVNAVKKGFLVRQLRHDFWAVSHAFLSTMPPHTHRLIYATACVC